ncbi:MAG TPA: polysaccharide deacetylase family protein [Pusillimonas sp.]|uniref:polysaccharide deacetylase family protein n=1 Tax=Pusillimonas sp. TaxID=3040095 RepID=UPI002CF71241|nr:polysaccharide deacetylase family protein [Pusillimonas sp.]HUH88689.1 polysaccharide deacetylase family protein [Pusillimonas sp.]
MKSAAMIPILMYHQIGQPAPKGTPYRGLTVHPASFRRQMYWMRRLGYQGLSMHDLLPYLQGVKQGKVFGITFDDGYVNVLDNALPILREMGFTSTNYFVARNFGGSNVWDLENGVPPSALMSHEQARAWVAGGQEVGSHGLDHSNLPDLDAAAAKTQIHQSRLELQDLLDTEVTAFCYPYGHETPALRDMVRQAGYTNATTTSGGLAQSADDPYGLPRVTVSRSTHIVRFLQKCLTRLEEKKRHA